jgi:hypothetical protein
VGDASHRSGLLLLSPVGIPTHLGFARGTLFDTKRLFDSQAERAPTLDAWCRSALERDEGDAAGASRDTALRFAEVVSWRSVRALTA